MAGLDEHRVYLSPMSDSAWLPILGATAGIIGAISGLVGCVLGYKGYRRAHEGKTLELRLELRKAVVDTRALVHELPGLMRRVDNTAFGRLSIENWEADQAVVRSLTEELSGLENDHVATKDHARLESGLVAVHRLTTQAERLKINYEEVLGREKQRYERRAADRRVNKLMRR